MAYDPTFSAMLKNMEKVSNATGKRFEELVAKDLKDFAKNENKARKNAGEGLIHVMPYSKAEDELHGTDIMFRDESGFFGHKGTMRLDVTHNFGSKDSMPFVANLSKEEKLVIRGLDGYKWDFHYGIRIGNPHENFKEPVIVIGFDMDSDEYWRFEKDGAARDNLSENIYEIVNMSSDMIKSFYYQADETAKQQMDNELDEDERPDPNLITFNEKYLIEAGKYASPRWTLPEDTRLAKQSRDLLQDIVYSPAVEKLDKKYEEQGLSDSINKMDKGSKGLEK